MFFDDNHRIRVDGSAFMNIQNVTLYCKIHDEFELIMIDLDEIGYGKVFRLRCPHCRKLGYLITSEAE